MEPNDAERGPCSGFRPMAKTEPLGITVRPLAAPRMVNGPRKAGNAAGEGRLLDSPQPDTELTQFEENCSNPGREYVPIPRLRGRCAAPDIQFASKSLPSPRSMRKAMGDSTKVAVTVDAINQSTGRYLAAEAVAPKARPRSKAASKKEVDVVIEIPADFGKAFSGRDIANGVTQGTSPLVFPPLPPAEGPAATETTTNNADQSPARVVQQRRDLFLLRSISTTIGTVVSRLFGRGHGHRELPPGAMETDAAGQPRSPLEVSVEIHVCPEARPVGSTVSAQSAASSAIFQDGGACQSGASEPGLGAPKAVSLTQVVTVKAPQKFSKRRVEDEVVSEKENRRGRERDDVTARIPTEAYPRSKTLEETSNQSSRLGGESSVTAVAKSDMEAMKKGSKKRTKESFERAVNSFEEARISNTLRERKTEVATRASILDPEGARELAQDAPLEGTHSPKQKPLKSSLKKTSTSEHLAKMLDVYTKRTEMLKSDTKTKGDRKKSAQAEATSPEPPKVTADAVAGAIKADGTKSPKAEERKKTRKDERKASKIETSPLPPEAMDEVFTGDMIAAEVKLPKGAKKSTRDKTKSPLAEKAKKKSGKSSRKQKRSLGADGTNKAKQDGSAATKEAKMIPSPRRTSDFDFERAVNQQKSEPVKKEAKTKTFDGNNKSVHKSGKKADYKDPKLDYDHTADGKDKKAADDGNGLVEEQHAGTGLPDEVRLGLTALLEKGQAEEKNGTDKEAPSASPKGEGTEDVLQKSLAKAEKAAEILAKGAENISEGEDDVVRVVRRRRDSLAVHRMVGMKKEKRPVNENEPEIGEPFSFALGRKKADGDSKDSIKDSKFKKEPGVRKSAMKEGGKRTAEMTTPEVLTPERTDHDKKLVDTKKISSIRSKSPSIEGSPSGTAVIKLPSKTTGELQQGKHGPLKKSGAEFVASAAQAEPARLSQPPSPGSIYLGGGSPVPVAGSPVPFADRHRPSTDPTHPPLPPLFLPAGASWLPGAQMPGAVPMGPQPPLDVDSRMNLMAMRGRMLTRHGRRKHGKSRGRKGPFAVGDSASKDLPPDKIKFSRIKLSAKQPRGEEEGSPVIHSPILDVGSPSRSPKGGTPVATPMTSVITSGVPEHDKGVELGEGIVADRDIDRSKTAALKEENEKLPKDGAASKQAKRKKKKRADKGTRSNLKPQSEVLSMEEILSQIRKKKMEHESETGWRLKAAREEHVPKVKKVKKTPKKKVEKRTADTQTSLPFAEPETPDVMLQSGDRRFCDFRFTVGVDRVVRGAVSHPDSLGPQGQERNAAWLPSFADATKGETSSKPMLPSEATRQLPLPPYGLDHEAPAAIPSTFREENKAPFLVGVVSDISNVGGKPTKLPPKKRNKQTRSQKRKKPKQETRSRKERDRQQRKKKRAPKRASSAAFLFRWRAPTAPRGGSDPGSAAHPLRNPGITSKLPGSQAGQLSRLFSWSTKATISTTGEEEFKVNKSVPDALLTLPFFESAVGPLRMPPLPRDRFGSDSPVSGAATYDERGGDVIQGKKGRQQAVPGMQEAVHVFQSVDTPLRLLPLPIGCGGFAMADAQVEIGGDALPRKNDKGESATDMQGIGTGFKLEPGPLRMPPLPDDRTCVDKAKSSAAARDDEDGDSLQGRNVTDMQHTVPFFGSADEHLYTSPPLVSRVGFGITKPNTAAAEGRDGNSLWTNIKQEKTVPNVECEAEPLHISPLPVDGVDFGVGIAEQDKKGGGAPHGRRGKETDVVQNAPTSAHPDSAAVTVNSSESQSLAGKTRTSDAGLFQQQSTVPKNLAITVAPETGLSGESLLRSKVETSKSSAERKHRRKRNGDDEKDQFSAKPLRTARQEIADKLQEDRGADTLVRQERGTSDKSQIEQEGTLECKICEEKTHLARYAGGETDCSKSSDLEHAKSISLDAEVSLSKRLVSNGPEIASAVKNRRSKKRASSSPQEKIYSIRTRSMSHTNMSPNNGSRRNEIRKNIRESESRRGKTDRSSSLRKSPEGSRRRRSLEYRRPDKKMPETRIHIRQKRHMSRVERTAQCSDKKQIAEKRMESERSDYRSFEEQSAGWKTSQRSGHRPRRSCSSSCGSKSRCVGSKRELSGKALSKTRRSQPRSSRRTGSVPIRKRGASASSSTSSRNQLSSSMSESPFRESSSTERRKRRHKRKKKRSGLGSSKRKLHLPGRSPSSHKSGGGSRRFEVVRIRSIDRVAENSRWSQNLACCCLLFLGASVAVLLVLSSTLLYFAVKTSPAARVSHTKPETKTYTIMTRTTRETIDPAVTGIIYYCDTTFCSQEARYVASVVRSDRKPCVNFYEHVCDKWQGQQNRHPAGLLSLLSRDSILQDSVAQQLLRLIRNAPERDVKTAANLYYSCAVNRSAYITSEDKAVFKAMFDRWEIRMWPRFDHNNLSGLSVWRFAAELARDLDIATLFVVSVGVDPGDVRKTILELDSLRPQFSDTDTEYQHAATVLKSAIQEAATELDPKVAFRLDDFADRLINVSDALMSASPQATSDETFTVLRADELSEGVRHFVKTLLSNVHARVSDRPMKVVARSPSYIRANLQTALLSVPLLDALNYIGFQALVRLAPFLPDRLRSLRTLFVNSIGSRTFADVTDTPRLCLWLAEYSLPGCFTKASQRWLRQRGQQDALREWLDQLESVFLRHVADFSWVSNLSSLLVRYRFKRRQVTQFGRLKDEHSCAPVVPLDATIHPLRYYLNLSTYRPHWRLRGLEENSMVLRQRDGFDPGSELRTVATFDQNLHRVHVPAAMFNLSVPSNSSLFVFQLARVAVRFYRGLVQALYENPYEREVPLSFTHESRRRLGELTTCFSTDAQRSSHFVQSTGSPPAQRQSLMGKLLLDQTSALVLALRAFDELLQVRRIWEADHRLREMPLQSAQQLFFVYFALDNCESAQAASHNGSRISANLRVNMPLSHLRLFAEAFNCTSVDNMTRSPEESCDVIRSSTEQEKRAGQRRQRGTRPMQIFEPSD